MVKKLQHRFVSCDKSMRVWFSVLLICHRVCPPNPPRVNIWNLLSILLMASVLWTGTYRQSSPLCSAGPRAPSPSVSGSCPPPSGCPCRLCQAEGCPACPSTGAGTCPPTPTPLGWGWGGTTKKNNWVRSWWHNGAICCSKQQNGTALWALSCHVTLSKPIEMSGN